MHAWAHPRPQPKRHLYRFSRFCAAHGTESLYLTMSRTFLPRNCHFARGSALPSNTWLLYSVRVHSPNRISIGSAVFAGLTSVTDRPTDRPRYSVYNNRPHLRSTAMRPNNTNNISIVAHAGWHSFPVPLRVGG